MFHGIKSMIEEKRNSMNIFWRFLVRAKDFLWKMHFALERVFVEFSGILRAKPRSKMKYVYRRFRYCDVPMWKKIDMELNSFCNRDCVWCPRYADRSGIRKDNNGNKVRKIMPMEKAYDLIDQASRLGFKGGIGFHRLSDGMLDPRFLKAWKYAKAKGMKLEESTNGDALRKNAELCAELDEQGNQLVIGIYDCETDVEREKEISFWRSRFFKAKIRFSEPLKRNLQLRQSALLYELAVKDPGEVDRPCVSQDEILLIRYDGNVSFCCQDDQCTFNLGNVFEQSIEEVWWSERRAEIRRTLRRPGGRRQFDLCKNCYALQRINDKERLSFIAGWVKQHG